jgi:hypothetical protein
VVVCGSVWLWWCGGVWCGGVVVVRVCVAVCGGGVV